uniref:asialoglycoprotein receptor 1-like n=1 Tax=Scatophagus argus TaxID=75038 RepID=UPI001ED80D80|nr:asialoglycoprotein receptor 1-like [Scatophagus argus]
MSEDLYAKLDLTKKVRFQADEKEDRNTYADDNINDLRIYDNYLPEGKTQPKSQDNTTEDQQQTTSVNISSVKNHLDIAAAVLGLLCLVLLAAVTVLVVLLIQDKNYWDMERNQLQTSYNEIKSFSGNLTLKTNQLEKERDLLKAINNNLTNEREEIESFNLNLTLKTNQLEKESDLLKAINNNLTTERDEIANITSQLEKERNYLNAINNNLTIEREELQKQLERTRCPDQWIRFEDGCYLISTSKKNWTDSKRFCEEKDAQLVIISSEMEQRFISSFGPRKWIGLTDEETENTWKWVNGKKETTLYWTDGQPDNKRTNGNGENCVEVYTSAPLNTWNDMNCNFQTHFICEKILQ